MVLALLFLGAYAWPVLDPDLSGVWLRACVVVTWLAWAAFAVDYVVRLGLAGDRRRFVRRNLLDLAVVVLPLLRPLRLLRLVRVLEVLNRAAADSLRGRVASYVVGGTALVMLVASLAALDAERGRPDATIVTFKDAVWWSFATITTVGYGDLYPVTDTGRLVATGLMVCGIGLLGVVTAWLASWLIDRVSEAEEESQAATRRDVAALTAEVRALREELARRTSR
jgi:voltage-gated potassium channel